MKEQVELQVYENGTIYLNNHRVKGRKVFVSENLSFKSHMINKEDLVDALENIIPKREEVFTREDMIEFAKYYITKVSIPYELEVLSGEITDEEKIKHLEKDANLIDEEWNNVLDSFLKK